MAVTSEDIENLVYDRLRVNRLALEVPAWVASAVARRIELWEDTLSSRLPSPPLSSSRLLSLLAQPSLLTCTSQPLEEPSGSVGLPARRRPLAQPSLLTCTSQPLEERSGSVASFSTSRRRRCGAPARCTT
jgi:hypothetical protein